MSTRLSHSATTKFMDCPTAYKFHYHDKLRSRYSHAALLFGSAVDYALGALLKPGEKTPEQIFEYFWTFQEINGQKTYLPHCTTIVYANSDFDIELLNAEDFEKITKEVKDDLINLDLKSGLTIERAVEKYIEEIYKRKEYLGFNGLIEEEKRILNYANWLVLKHKGRLMIEAVRKEIIPNIEEVLGIQEYVKLENIDGDSIVGFADFVCKYKGHDEPIVFDFKTSSKLYDEDAVLTSPQLTLYVHALSDKFNHTRKAGYIVLNKVIRKNKEKTCKSCGQDGTGKRHKTCDIIINDKRCNGEWKEVINPSVFVQVLIDNIPEQTEDIVLQNMDYINQSIKNGIFHRNLASCKKPYGKCIYFDKCYKGKDTDLIKVEK